MNKKSILFAALSVMLGATLFALAFSKLPVEEIGLGIDWRVFWEATHGLRADYSSNLLFTPPWILPILWPLTLFPFAASWALAMFALLVLLILSVPRNTNRARWAAGVLVLCLSYPALRQFADGNLEFMLIAGTLLTLYALPRQQIVALALGVLLLTTKVQVSWLFLLFVAYHLWKAWPRRNFFLLAAALLGAVLPTFFLRGGAWLQALATFPFSGSAIDSSLLSSLARTGLPPTVIWLLWGLLFSITIIAIRRSPGFGRAQAAFLLTAGLLLAPYAASNSVLTPLAIGIIPFFQKRVGWGIVLLTLFSLPYAALADSNLRLGWEATYWTAVLFVTWLVLLWDLHPSSAQV